MPSTMSPGLCPQEAHGIMERQTDNKALEQNVVKTVTKTYAGHCGDGEMIPSSQPKKVKQEFTR